MNENDSNVCLGEIINYYISWTSRVFPNSQSHSICECLITVFGLFQWDNKLPGILVKILKITRKLFSPLELFTKYHRAWIQPLRLLTVANRNGAGHFIFLLIDCLCYTTLSEKMWLQFVLQATVIMSMCELPEYLIMKKRRQFHSGSIVLIQETQPY